ncbi:MAG: hypothetical protein JKX84_00475 [Flavobacteriales bacterium]|nr:hypothetical protein [Flavobacteriales bacterium]
MKALLSFLFLIFSVNAVWSQQGEYKKFEYASGVVSSEGYMLDGQPEGYWKTYYENGTLKSEGNRQEHQLDSLWKFYTETGIISQSITYLKGKKNGQRKTFFEDGVLQRSESFSNNVLIDKIRTFYPSGKLMVVVPLDTLGKGKEQGLGYEFDEKDGRIVAVIQYRNGYIGSRERINRKDKFNQKQGLWREFYEDRKVKVEGRYKNGKRNGYFKTYDTDGNLLETLKYVDGILIPNPEELAKLDIKREYHPNAQVKSVGSYSKGIKEGVHRIYTMDGKVESAKIYLKGKMIGNGIVDPEGRRQGVWKEYYDTGELRSEGKYKDGSRIGPWIFYYQGGKEEQRGEYHKGKPDGEWKWTYQNGNTWREEVFYEGLEEGLAIEYNDTGKVVSKGSYIDGERDGEWLIDLGDNRQEGSYVAGLKQGMWKYFYPSGKKRFDGKFVQGREDGKHEYFYENGQTRTVGKYKFGMKEGDWFDYDEEGLQTGIITYKQDEVVKVDGEKVDLSDIKED